MEKYLAEQKRLTAQVERSLMKRRPEKVRKLTTKASLISEKDIRLRKRVIKTSKYFKKKAIFFLFFLFCLLYLFL